MTATEKKLAKLKKGLLSALRKESADFGLYVVPNAEMERLRRALRARRDFKGAEARKIAHEKEVNVLSFPEPKAFPHPETGKRWLGEVYLNRAFARLGADRLPFLMVHGVLHLLGYRHEKRRDIMKMEALERKLCRALGIRP